jgi:hypothetical protein
MEFNNLLGIYCQCQSLVYLVLSVVAFHLLLLPSNHTVDVVSSKQTVFKFLLCYVVCAESTLTSNAFTNPISNQLF